MRRLLLSSSVVVRLVAAALLFWAIGDHPSGYYKALRWLVCAAGVYAVILNVAAKKIPSGDLNDYSPSGAPFGHASTFWAWVLGIIAVLFNPIFPVHLDRATWQAYDATAGLFFLVSAYFIREQLDPR